MAQVALDELRRLQGITGEPSMAGGDCSCRYGVLGRHLRNEEHGKAEKLSASPTVVVVASGRAPKRVVDGGCELERERERARLRLNPRKTRPKSRSGGTYGFGGSR